MPSERPSRLIQIDQDVSKIRLVVDFPASVRSLALSYHQGSPAAHGQYLDNFTDTIMLRSQCKAALDAGIIFSSLPRTIQDTCTLLSKLGCQHLSVDRLCVTQDSDNDWHREAGRMASVYKHAGLTTAASCAASEDHGFFRKRSHNDLTALRLFVSIKSDPLAGLEVRIYSDEPDVQNRLRGKLGHLCDWP